MAILAAVVVVVAGALGVALTWLSIDLLIVSLMGPYVLTLLLLGFTRGAAGATLLSAVGLVGLIVASAVIHTELSGPYMFPFLILPMVVLATARLGRLRQANWFVRNATIEPSSPERPA